MPRAIVLGAGMVGSVMAADLATEPELEVTLADISAEALARGREKAGGRVQTCQVDFRDVAEVKGTVEPFDVVLGALASRIGFQTLGAVIEAKKNYCDISYMPEDAWALDDLAKANGVSAVIDCGVAPGMSNLLAGYSAAQLDHCERIGIYVGGLPRERRWPFQYKAAFSPADVIEEYTRPARVVEHGRVVSKEALSDVELITFPGLGTLEAFNTDGLRSLTHFLTVPCMNEKTLRYPGHAELMRIFRETGFFSTEPIRLGQSSVRPLDLISAVLFPLWSYAEGEEDLTVMRLVVEGRKGKERIRDTWSLLDFYDRESQTTSMARNTAFPCTIMARMLLSGDFKARGVIPPEIIGRESSVVQRVLEQLAQRGIHYVRSLEAIE